MQRLRSASVALQTSVTDETILKCFKAGLPSGLQDQAILVTGDFDTIVRIMSRLSGSQRVVSRKKTREVQEASADSSSSQSWKGDQRHVKCCYCQKMGHMTGQCLQKEGDLACGAKGGKLKKA